MATYKKALVTGGAGFIGSHLVDALIRRRIKVVVLDDLSYGKKANVNPNAEFIQLSITSPKLASVVKKIQPDIIFHYAALKNVRESLKNPVYDAEVNVLGTLSLIEAGQKAGVKKFVFASTGGAMYADSHKHKAPWSEEVVDEPVSPYGVAKRAGELYFNFSREVYGIPFVALRYANVFGPRQDGGGEGGVVSIFGHAMLTGKPAKIFGTGKQTRDFVFVEDCVRAAMLGMEKSVSGIFNIGTGKETDVNELFRKLKKMTGSDALEKHAPGNPGEVMRSVLDARLAKRVLGWRPTVSLDEGLKKTVEWLKGQK